MDLAFNRGEGCYLYTTDGTRYLDLVAGIAVNSIGHSHPMWVSAMQAQVARLAHVSNLYHIPEQAELAAKIASVAPGDLKRTLFVNSGAEANEGALKVAVRYTGRGKVLSALGGFHGRTAASLGATGQEVYRNSFEPLISDAFQYYEFGNCEQIKEMVGPDTAAVMVEPIQGEGGVRTASKEFFKTVRDVCTDRGALMISDEVQTGMGRTGAWFGIDNHDVVPDIITMAKGLGGGAPIGAVVTTDEIAAVMTPGTHGTTFGGNPLVCASGNAVFTVGGVTKAPDETWNLREKKVLTRFDAVSDSEGRISGTFAAADAAGGAFNGLTIVGSFPDFVPRWGMRIVVR